MLVRVGSLPDSHGRNPPKDGTGKWWQDPCLDAPTPGLCVCSLLCEWAARQGTQKRVGCVPQCSPGAQGPCAEKLGKEIRLGLKGPDYLTTLPQGRSGCRNRAGLWGQKLSLQTLLPSLNVRPQLSC